jgi:hypothetical protein
MLLILEIAMLIAGIVALVKGEFNLTRNKVVRGAVARVIGVLLLAPLPIAFAIVFAVAARHTVQGRDPNDTGLRLTYALIEIGVIALFGVTAIVVAAFNAEAPKRKKRKRRDEEDEEEYEEPPRRRRPRYEDEEDDRPQPRRRPREEDEEEELPPRRRPRAADDEDRPRRRPDDRYRD